MSDGDEDVIAMSHTVYDAGGNVTERHSFEMNHDDTADIGINLSNNDDYVRRSIYSWYDSADRITAMADFGAGGASTGAGSWKYNTFPTYDSTAPTASAEDQLVTLYAYDNDTGRQNLITGPDGTATKTFYDDAGRRLFVVENHKDSFDPTGGISGFMHYGKNRTTGWD